ncbi:hypothetical protein [Microbulbifer discodermiae]|uniref:hypothetical protein n=2 Tax=unclassified Microbulbifer TaxID=2619833 RepID=UPI00345B72BF
MQDFYIFLLSVHAVSNAMWVGAVFMGSIIDWPAIKAMAKNGKFPFLFVVGQGSNVFFWVYLAIFLQITTSTGLAIMHPPEGNTEILFLGLRTFALSIMIGFTLYGTFSSWPKLQVSSSGEAWTIYRYYMYRAYAIFACGLLNTVAMVMLYMDITR